MSIENNQINEYEEKFLRMKKQRDTLNKKLIAQTGLNDILKEKINNIEECHAEFKKDYKESCNERNKLELKLEKKGMSKEHLEEFNKYKDFYNKNIEVVNNINNNDYKDNIINTKNEEIAELKAQVKIYMKKWEDKCAENIIPKEKNNNEKKEFIEKIDCQKKKIKELKEELEDVNRCNKDLSESVDEIEKKSEEWMNKYHTKCFECTELLQKSNKYLDLYNKEKDNKYIVQEKIMDSIQTQTENIVDEDKNFFINNDLKLENEKLQTRCNKSHENNEVLREKVKELDDRNSYLEGEILVLQSEAEDRENCEVNNVKNITNKEINRQNIDNVFDLVFKEKMKKTNDEKIYRRLANKRNDISKKILNNIEKNDNKLDYSAEFVKYIINII